MGKITPTASVRVSYPDSIQKTSIIDVDEEFCPFKCIPPPPLKSHTHTCEGTTSEMTCDCARRTRSEETNANKSSTLVYKVSVGIGMLIIG